MSERIRCFWLEPLEPALLRVALRRYRSVREDPCAASGLDARGSVPSRSMRSPISLRGSTSAPTLPGANSRWFDKPVSGSPARQPAAAPS